jgi:hypothetical protein
MFRVLTFFFEEITETLWIVLFLGMGSAGCGRAARVAAILGRNRGGVKPGGETNPGGVPGRGPGRGYGRG